MGIICSKCIYLFLKKCNYFFVKAEKNHKKSHKEETSNSKPQMDPHQTSKIKKD